MKILVADDSKAMRMIVVRTLRQAGMGGHDIVEAEDGVQALERVADSQPDLILSDWNMPNMTGIDLLHALRSRGDRTPFCFVTSEGSEDMREEAQHAGAIGLIAKPFTPDTFTDVLAPVVAL